MNDPRPLLDARLQAARAYWQELFAEHPPRPAHPPKRGPRPGEPSAHEAGPVVGPVVGPIVGPVVELPPELVVDLAALTRGSEFLTFAALAAATLWALEQVSGVSRPALATPPLGADYTGASRGVVIGPEVAPGGTFRELLRTTRAALLAAYEHQEWPLEPVAAVALRAAGQHAPFAPGSAALNLEWANTTLSATFDPRGFDAATVERFLARVLTCLTRGLAELDAPLGRLDTLPAAESELVLGRWNHTAVPLDPAEVLLHRGFLRQAALTPAAEALRFGGASWTYQQLEESSRRLAGRLRSLGVGPDVRVAISLERGPAMAIGVLGVLRAGGACVPIDPAYPAERQQFMLADTAAPVLLTDASGPAVPLVGPVVIRPEVFDDPRWELAEEPADLTPEHLFYVIYTSGSTGRPKGIELSHRAMGNLLAWHRRTLTTGRRTLQYASLSFDASFHEMFAAWGTGGNLVMVPEELRRDVPALLDLLLAERVEKAIFPVVVFHRLAEEALATGRLPLDLVEITTTGEQLQVTAAMRELVRRLGGAVLHNHYGPSESHVVTAWTAPPEPAAWPSHPPIGAPIDNSTLHVVDAGFRPSGVAVPGELLIGGHGLARGYLGRPRLTAERFVPDPFTTTPGARLYRTGDLARWLPGGELEFLGRIDSQVKIRGFRVELGEIEAALVSLPGVQVAVVVAVVARAPEGPAVSSADRQLVAYWVAAGGGERAPSPGELHTALAERLPDYLVPAAFVRLEALPMTPNRKVDRAALPAPRPEDAAQSADGGGPRTPTEALVARIWAELLGGEADQLPRQGDFFRLGGHSLLAAQVMSRLRDALGVEVPLRVIFSAPTLEAFAAAVEAERTDALPPLPPLPPLEPLGADAPRLLSPAQERLWFLDQLAPGSAAFHQPTALELAGPLDVTALERAVVRLLGRHEVLRAVFPAGDEGPRWERGAVAQPVVRFHDLRHRPDAAPDLAARQALAPFDLTRGPLLRVDLAQVGEARHWLLVNLHHIVSDGWSVAILVRELVALYREEAGGQSADPANLPALPVQYADYAAWHRAFLASPRAEAELAYWRAQLADLPELELPLDRPRAKGGGHGPAAQLSLPWPAELTAAVDALAARFVATRFMVVLASFQALLHRLTGQGRVAVGSPLANRDHTHLEGLIGLFVNLVTLVCDAADEPRFVTLLQRVRATSLDAWAHRLVPFERVVEAVAPAGERGGNPLFRVVVNQQNLPSAELAVPGLTLRGLPLPAGAAKYDLNLTLDDRPEALGVAFEFDTAVFDRVTVERWGAMWLRLLADATSSDRAPERSIGRLALLSAAEHRQLTREWAWGPPGYREPTTLDAVFRAHARSAPDRLAALWPNEGPEEGLTYGDLDTRSARLAAALQARGVGVGQVVALCLAPSPTWLVAVVAVVRAGAAYLPLDPADPPERRALLLADARASLLLDATTLGELGSAEPRELPARHGPDDRAYVLYTSGSTGRPKGVAVSHHAVLRLVLDTDYVRLGPADRFAQVSHLSFDAATFEVWGALLHGGCLVGFARETVLEPAAFAAALAATGVTAMFLTVTLFNQTVAAEPRAFAGVRHLLVGGEALAAGPLRAVLASGAPPARLQNGYGPTENTTFTATHLIEAVPEGAVTVPIGRPIAGTTTYVVDARGELAPVGVAGELLAGGLGVAEGYHHKPRETAAAFVPDPFSGLAGARLYRTGDRVRWRPDGVLEYLGRLDQQVKIRGFRIEPGEIAEALRAHPAVEAAAVVVETVDGGAEPATKRLVAYLVLSGEGGGGIQNTLRQHLRAALPPYMVPAVFREVAALPLGPTGKLDAARLADLPWRDLAPTAGEGAVGELPTRPNELAVAAAFQELLGLDTVGLDDSFFDLGGHSLSATRLVNRLAESVGVRLPLAAVFAGPTVRELAAELDRHHLEVADDTQLEALLAELEGLSDEEVERRLAATRPNP